MKTYQGKLLLFLWLFALAAPTVIVFMDRDTPVTVSNLNEEEQETQGNKSLEEKFVITHIPSVPRGFDQQDRSMLFAYIYGNSVYAENILLPPPKGNV